MIICPKCGGNKTEQSDTRQRPNTSYTWRRRSCKRRRGGGEYREHLSDHGTDNVIADADVAMAGAPVGSIATYVCNLGYEIAMTVLVLDGVGVPTAPVLTRTCLGGGNGWHPPDTDVQCTAQSG